MKKLWRIEDWAGNMLDHGLFDNFEDAWGFIYEHFPEDVWQDLYVIEVNI